MPALLDLTGQRFKRLVVTSRAANRGRKPSWNCVCDCGKQVIARASDLRSGRHGSCGCLHKEIVTFHGNAGKHGLPKTKSHSYGCWISMKSRCLTPRNTGYRFYGARGITVCDRWARSFSDFLSDMGEAPSRKHTLDRYPDQGGNYEPGNVRWATRKQQSNNRRVNRLLVFRGMRKTVSEWCDHLGLNEHRVRSRLRAGWTAEQALTAPKDAVVKQGAFPSRVIDIAGMRFGMLTVIDRAKNRSKRACWNCLCDCGRNAIVTGKALRHGHTKSCGCNRGKPGIPKPRK